MKKLNIMICLLSFAPLIAQSELASSESQQLAFYNDAVFNLQSEAMQDETVTNVNKKKNGVLAVLLSAAIPGAGEYYAESYWKSALFVTIEAAVWLGYIHYYSGGEDKENEMFRLGDEQWDEERYWSRVYDYAVTQNKWELASLETDGKIIKSDQFTNEVMDHLRHLESQGNLNDHFSHTLPQTKTQQYYEMIYKYPSQFGAGWIELEDWTYYDNGSNQNNLTPVVARYKKIRNESNDLYSTAKNMAMVALLNHLVSAFDAGLTVKDYNSKVRYSFYNGIKYHAGEKVPTIGLALAW